MIHIDSNEMSLQWGSSQVVHMNAFVEDPESRNICFESTPVFNQFTSNDKWTISISAAGLLESEINASLKHLQDGSDVLVITGESQPRPITETHTYLYKKFQKRIQLPRDVIADSKTSGFSNGILIVSFHRQGDSEWD